MEFTSIESDVSPPSAKTRIVIQRSWHQAQYFEEDLGNEIKLAMVLIPEGSFMMGSPEDEEGHDEFQSPQHEVTVKAFSMGKYPVTQTQWKIVAALPKVELELDSNPSRFKGGDRPVERVSWYDAVEFCARLSQKTGRNYRLPSEAEWEYACRAGTKTPFHFGETITTELANYNGNHTYGAGVKGVYREETTPVGSFGVANAFGLYDMHGNVWEWCADPWHDNYQGAPQDSRVWDEKNNDNRYQNHDVLVNIKNDNRTRPVRGGSWLLYPVYCRAACRFIDVGPGVRDNGLGFRVVCAVVWLP
jgi:formylglycine-generating enzyme required for sulfatase activity